MFKKIQNLFSRKEYVVIRKTTTYKKGKPTISTHYLHSKEEPYSWNSELGHAKIFDANTSLAIVNKLSAESKQTNLEFTRMPKN